MLYSFYFILLLWLQWSAVNCCINIALFFHSADLVFHFWDLKVNISFGHSWLTVGTEICNGYIRFRTWNTWSVRRSPLLRCSQVNTSLRWSTFGKHEMQRKSFLDGNTFLRLPLRNPTSNNISRYGTGQHLISFHFIPFHCISFHFIAFHSISFHFIPFHSISFHFIPLHSIAFLLPFRVITFRTHRCMTGQAIESLGCHPVRSPHPSYSTPLLLFHPISASSVGSVAPDACHFAVLSSRGG